MKKRLFTFFLLLFVTLPCVLIFSACGSKKDSGINSSYPIKINFNKDFEFSNNQFLFEYGDDVEFDFAKDFEVILNYDDGSTKTLVYGDKDGYSVDSTIPEKNAWGKIDAGEYTLTLKHVEGENDEIEITKYFTVQVSKKKIQNPVLTNSSFVFNGDNVDIRQYIDFKGNEEFVDLINVESKQNVGTYYVQYQIKNDYSKNYEFANSITALAWEIESAVVKYPTVAGGLKSQYNFTYQDGVANTIVLNFDNSSDSGHGTWTFSSEITKTISDDGKSITFSVSEKGTFEIEFELDSGYEFDNGSSNLIQIVVVVGWFYKKKTWNKVSVPCLFKF